MGVFGDCGVIGMNTWRSCGQFTRWMRQPEVDRLTPGSMVKHPFRCVSNLLSSVLSDFEEQKHGQL